MTLGQLIFEFFNHYTTDFNFVSEVVSIRIPGGVMYKQEKGWTSAKTRVGDGNSTYQDRYLLALEDPFEITHNVGRTCSTNGVKRIRSEMQRAALVIKKASMPQQTFNSLPNQTSNWDRQNSTSIHELLQMSRDRNGGFRNRRVNQRNLLDWIKNDWTVGKCLAQIDSTAEDNRRRRELGLLEDAELPPESDDGSEEASEDEDEGDSDTELARPMIATEASTEPDTSIQFGSLALS